MSNGNQNPQPAGDQPAPKAGQQVAPPEHPDEPMRRKKRARHEAGHAVATDEFGGESLTINISKTNGKPWKAETKWPKFDLAEANIKLFERTISVVAGPVAEQELDEEFNQKTLLVSEMTTDGNLDGSDTNYASMDVKQTVRFLHLIKQLTRAMILEAEAEARKVLAKRKAHLDDLADKLEKQHYMEKDDIKKALGKGNA